jgi:N-methylhydantoinase A
VVTVARLDDALRRSLGARFAPEAAVPAGRRAVVFNDPQRPIEATILWRPSLAADTEVAGPAVIEEQNATTFLPPGDRAVIDAYGNIIIDVGTPAR